MSNNIEGKVVLIAGASSVKYIGTRPSSEIPANYFPCASSETSATCERVEIVPA